MSWIVNNLWLIPGLPLLAAGLIALIPRAGKRPAATLAIGALSLSFLLACIAMATATGSPGTPLTHNFTWLEFGATALRLGWVLDPLGAVMLVMVTFVGTLIFIYSVGYMAHDANFTRFFCFLSLFAAAMLGVIIANNLLLLFMCWELVGLASYLLIGFWFQKPSAAAAAKKAFITTRIGDMGLFLGMLWLYSETGSLLFYDGGAGCLEASAVAHLVGKSIGAGLVASTGISLLIFCGAIGKSGQIPLHVWLPDAMEGPTPVSALIHAATMVAAGVFLMARVYPVVSALPGTPPAAPLTQAAAPKAASMKVTQHDQAPKVQGESSETATHTASVSHEASPQKASLALQLIAWIGALTALFAALIAVAQTDIKRILAYSTVSQLGYMFLGLATGGVAVGMFHLITHAFFKALLFLGAGSVIHGCHEEQDIRRMGGLRRLMPVTFLTYAVGMMALAGVPLLFSGFWSKDEILHSAAIWTGSKWPFVFALAGAVLTAFYMTRQMIYVFWGDYRGHSPAGSLSEESAPSAHSEPNAHGQATSAHESPSVMTVPLGILAVCAVLLSALGTPVWPWFHAFLSGHAASWTPQVPVGVLVVMLLSVALVSLGIGLGVWIYTGKKAADLGVLDPLESAKPEWFAVLRGRFFIDELYEKSFIFWGRQAGRFCAWLDDQVIAGAVRQVKVVGLACAWVVRLVDDFAVNLGWDRGCDSVRRGGWWASWIQNGQTHRYLRALALGIAGLMVWVLWR